MQQRPSVRIHRRFPKLFGIHFTQSFVALNRQIFLRRRQHAFEQFFARRDFFLCAVLTHDKRSGQSFFQQFVKLDRFVKLNVARKVPIDSNAVAGLRCRFDLHQPMLVVRRKIGLVTCIRKRAFDLGHLIIVRENLAQRSAFISQHAFPAGKGLEQCVQ